MMLKAVGVVMLGVFSIAMFFSVGATNLAGYARQKDPDNTAEITYEEFMRRVNQWDGSLEYVWFAPERLDAYLRSKCPKSPMIGTMEMLLEACEEYNVNPAAVLAISGHETFFCTARNPSAADNSVDHNNPYGLMSGGSFLDFAEVADSHTKAAETLRNKHIDEFGIKSLDLLSATWTWGHEFLGQVNESWYEGVNTLVIEIYAFCAPISGDLGSIREKIIEIAQGEVGKPYYMYDFAPLDPTNHSCSTLVEYVTNTAGLRSEDGVSLLKAPSQTQWAAFARRGGAVRAVSYFDMSQRGIQPGDVLFFFGSLASNGSQPPPAHVGIYVGNGRYVHASGSRTGVINSDLQQPTSEIWGFGRLEVFFTEE